ESSARVEPGGLRWISGGRERVEADAFSILDGLSEILSAAAFKDRTQQCVTLIGLAGQRDIAIGYSVFGARWQDQIFAALSRVDTCWSNILKWRLPDIHDAASDRTSGGRRD